MKKSNWLGVKKISSFSTHTFTNKKLLDIALTHRSVGSDNNERLEYLGDAILGFIIAEYLYINFTEAAEGDLTRLRAMLVKKETLALIARENSLDKKIRLGTGELKSGGWRRDSILANTLEAIIGAIYLDSNIEECRVIINKLYEDHFKLIDPKDVRKDPKSLLQEYLQSRKKSTPIYEVIKEKGSSHNPEFTIGSKIELLDEIVTATGNSKRKAEQEVAAKILHLLDAKKIKKWVNIERGT